MKLSKYKNAIIRNVIAVFPIIYLLLGTVSCDRRKPEPAPLLVGIRGAEGLGDPLYPLMGNGGYDVQHYTLELLVNVVDNEITGFATIEAVAAQNLSGFNLDLLGLTVSEVSVNDALAEFNREGQELIIKPAEILPEGDNFSVQVRYSGQPQTMRVPIQGIEIYQGWVSYAGGTYAISEPEGAAVWYPVNNHPRDKATYTFKITVPNPYVAVANGLLLNTINNGTTTTYVWEAADLTASYLVNITIALFEIDEREGPERLPLISFFEGGLIADAEIALSDLPDMISFFSETFGPYPFESYGIIVIDATPRAMEVQTRSLFGGLLYQNETLRAHELAHQWFGNSVSLHSWSDVWLKEGFASYASALWIGHQYGKEFFLDWVCERYERGRYHPAGSPAADNIFNIGVYHRGESLLHALRLKVGDEVFFTILPAYHDRYKYGTASTADFISIAEEISGQELNDFFDAWLYDEVAPEMPGC